MTPLALAASGAETAATLTTRGIALFKDANTEADVQHARVLFEQAIAADHAYVPAHVWRGVALMESEQWREQIPDAIVAFSTARQLDPTGERFGYADFVNAWMLKLVGRPGSVLVIHPCASKGDCREWGSVIDGFIRYRPEEIPVEEFHLRSANRPDEAAYGRLAAENGFGWCLVVDVPYTTNPFGDLLGSDKRVEDLSYRSANRLETRAVLLDASDPSFRLEIRVEHKTGDDNIYAVNIEAIKACAETTWKRVQWVMERRNAADREDLAFLSLPTDAPGVYAKAGMKDRAHAKRLPALLLLPPRSARDAVEDELAHYAAEAVAQGIFTSLVTRNTVAVIHPRELTKLEDQRPDEWDDDAAVAFARSLGENCRWVAMPTIDTLGVKTRTKRNLLLQQKKHGTADCKLRCRLIDVHTGRAVTVTAKASAKSADVKQTHEGLDDLLLIAAFDAVDDASSQLAGRLTAPEMPATVAVLPYTSAKGAAAIAPETTDMLRNTMYNLLYDSEALYRVYTPEQVEAMTAGIGKRDNIHRYLADRGVSACVTGECTRIDIARDAEDPARVTVTVSLAVELYRARDAQSLLTLDQTESMTVQVPAELSDKALDDNPEVQAALTQSALGANIALAARIKAAIPEHEDTL